MRPIKFRVWNPSGQNMLYDIDNVFECLKQQIKFDGTMPDRGFIQAYNHKGEGMVWMQFTGLHDKNGKEIFEGDIIGDWVEVDGKMEQSRQTVFWHEQEAQWMLDNSHKQDQSHFFSLAGELKDFEYEIIGNIHENPELLK